MTDGEEVYEGIEIDDIAHGGDGVGRLPDGQVVFVPRTTPGDRADVRVVEDRPNWVRAEVVRFRERADDRIESDCPFYRECGGCQYWHVPYELEVDYKTDAALEVIGRAGDLELPELEVTKAPSDRHYRTRVRFHRRRQASGEWEIGFFAHQSHELVEIDACLVSHDVINRARRDIEKGVRDVGNAELLIETANADSAVISILPKENAPEEPPESLIGFAGGLDAIDSIRGVRFVGDDKEWVGGDASVDGREVLADSPVETIRIPAGLFRQANPEVNRLLVDAVRDAVRAARASSVLELFCGVGNLTFAMHDSVDRLLGVEVDDVAVEMAETMAQFAQCEGVAFVQGDLAGGFTQIPGPDTFDYDTVVLDPPRGGAPGVCRELVDSTAETIIYVSCDPAALGRDLKTLAEGGWRPSSLRMFDMFPRTSHVETLAVLER